jgi:hypothetical protein
MYLQGQMATTKNWVIRDCSLAPSALSQSKTIHPEPVEGHARLRQAQPERRAFYWIFSVHGDVIGSGNPVDRLF